MRSLLFVPGDSEKKLEKGFGSGADCVIVDLEDSVALANKATARAIAAGFLAARNQVAGPRIYIRVNDLASGLIDDDLGAAMAARPDGIMLPKANSSADAMHLSAKLRVHEVENGIPDGSTAILAIMTETAAGLLAASTWGATNRTPRLAGLTWGAEDLSAVIGAHATRDAEGRYTDVFRHARTMTILAASACDVAAIDTVFVNFRDEAGLRHECADAERDGFTGKMAIHPVQVPIINEAFTPSAQAVEHAQSVIEAFENAGNPGVVAIDGKMYDRPHLTRATRLLARAGVLR
ncbi:CoA ester lyase [Mesorhizobium sp. NBSH29]|uniref:HpcH/HpaI aldolase/citrate lyase family protein n=1 Tax=Mesorhizobium sp. NBSH29 TaxID=2654249 RepID=UPI0018968A46|nr:CoA ester lyase [Mesorhizobium sp. NBSH29]QPC88697.1 CoA ester lyase [Mesorhizobium sp. NBSH29]